MWRAASPSFWPHAGTVASTESRSMGGFDTNDTTQKGAPTGPFYEGGPTDRGRYQCRSSFWADRFLPLAFSSKIPREHWAGRYAAGCYNWRVALGTGRM
jgi:hypothetical protein